MPHFEVWKVESDPLSWVGPGDDKSYRRGVTSESAKSAAEEYAQWFCFHTTEYTDFGCAVLERGAIEPEIFEISVFSVPVFRATAL